jgi:hypothetical protein
VDEESAMQGSSSSKAGQEGSEELGNPFAKQKLTAGKSSNVLKRQPFVYPDGGNYGNPYHLSKSWQAKHPKLQPQGGHADDSLDEAPEQAQGNAALHSSLTDEQHQKINENREKALAKRAMRLAAAAAEEAPDTGEDFFPHVGQAEDEVITMAVEARGWETCDIHVYVCFCSV